MSVLDFLGKAGSFLGTITGNPAFAIGSQIVGNVLQGLGGSEGEQSIQSLPGIFDAQYSSPQAQAAQAALANAFLNPKQMGATLPSGAKVSFPVYGASGLSKGMLGMLMDALKSQGSSVTTAGKNWADYLGGGLAGMGQASQLAQILGVGENDKPGGNPLDAFTSAPADPTELPPDSPFWNSPSYRGSFRPLPNDPTLLSPDSPDWLRFS